MTVSCTTANSYLEASSREAGAAAELAASNKVVNYAGLSSQCEFVPTAVESHSPINRDALQFLIEFGRRFLFSRISVVVQSFKPVMHSQFDARPTVTFVAPSTRIELQCLLW